MSYTMGDRYAYADVVEMHKVCEREAELPVIGANLALAYAMATAEVISGERTRERLMQSVVRLVGEACAGPTIATVCPFDGDVEVSLDRGVGYWTCPICDQDHEDDENDH